MEGIRHARRARGGSRPPSAPDRGGRRGSAGSLLRADPELTFTDWAALAAVPKLTDAAIVATQDGEITLSSWYGQGQGPTSVSVEANPGGVWQQVLAATAITWNSDTGTVETRTLTLPSAITATQFRIVIRAANLTWNAVTLNEIAMRS